MGTRGREIVGKGLPEVLEILNEAYADEWLAYYQYWLGAKLARGPMKDAVMAELMQHAADELRHADLVANRIIQLGGTPLTSPEAWMKGCRCGYAAPLDPDVMVLLSQNIQGERCAIDEYRRVMELTRDADPVTYNLALTILQDEVEHEEDLESLQEDLQILLARPR